MESLKKNGSSFDLTDYSDQESIFSTKLNERESYYQRMNKVSEGRGDLERARDLEQWRQDPAISAGSISRFLSGDQGRSLIVIFDNVDRLSNEDQLYCFKLAQWFKDVTKCLILLPFSTVVSPEFPNIFFK